MPEVTGNPITDLAARAGVAQKLFEARAVVICGEIQSELVRTVVEQLLALSAASSDDITLYLHSPGGHVESGDTIHDLLRFIQPRTNIVGTGWVASAGAHIYLAVPREQRFCLPNTRFLLHHRGPDRSAAQEGREGHRAQLLDVGRSGKGVRPGRPDHLLGDRAEALSETSRALPTRLAVGV